MPDLNWIIGLITPAEWAAVLWLMLLIYAATEIAKRAWRLFTKQYGPRVAWIAAALVSFAGASELWPEASIVPWWIAGIIGGPMSNVLYKVTVWMIDRVSPGFARLFTGERRREDEPPPGGLERRQSDRDA